MGGEGCLTDAWTPARRQWLASRPPLYSCELFKGRHWVPGGVAVAERPIYPVVLAQTFFKIMGGGNRRRSDFFRDKISKKSLNHSTHNFNTIVQTYSVFVESFRISKKFANQKHIL